MVERQNLKKNKLMSLLLEYLKDSNRSDRQIAKALGVSQATVSKMKRELLEEGLLKNFSAIPDLAKMGYEIMAISFVKFNMKQMMKIENETKQWMQDHSEIIFSARTEGMGMDAVNISLHKDYAAYQKFLTYNKKKWPNMMAEVQYVVIDLVGGIAKPFSFEYLAEKRKN